MNLGICITVAILMSLINVYYWELRHARIENEEVKVIKPYLPHSLTSKIETIAMFIAIVAVGVVLCLVYKDNSILFNVRRIALIAILFPASLSDYRKHIIPNTTLIMGLGYWVIITILEFIFDNKNAFRYVVVELVVAFIFLGCLLFLRLVIKNGIGMGDVKLFMIMALFQAYSGLMSSVLTSLIALFLAAVVLLITKKKGKRDYIPFAPAILAGTYLSIMMIGA